MSYPIRVRAGAVIIESSRILLIEFDDEKGVHYNLPSGGVEHNETIQDAAKREAKEEADVEVEVGPLAFVYEYEPKLNNYKYGDTHSLSLYFECKRYQNSNPQFPANPDPNQTDVKWISIEDFDDIVLYPNIKNHIKNYLKSKSRIDLIQENQLPPVERSVKAK
ncbi:ADP-ribose pyrophosphatase YjhB, NUDIX family [Gracilibacillus ureilyticus]|uniref:ADP-ribose pyrophosphatase YjhB, NUDIX family n=1 Tax=Gracilibacillus ureilyticus TaxID=531814 RepID=A0A1H9RUH0_9BACI|nr:NUDIX domain-containing protein [Gracilibacillus ureilyticus]SER75763.1 ADP-ribose pyrophosphatase YjhB, NUDIX family [Gracilibacillus ureilyticus]